MAVTRLLFALWLFAFAFSGASFAQTISSSSVRSPILVVDTDQIYGASDFGRRVARQVKARGEALALENRSIEAVLANEEQKLTDQRGEMSAQDFRVLADAFDAKVQQTRRQQDIRINELNDTANAEQAVFFKALEPVLEALMRDAGAAVLLERRTVVLNVSAVDITARAVDAMNDLLGDGTASEELPAEPAQD